MPAAAFGQFLRHEPDNDDPLQTRDSQANKDDRRPSTASAMTASSRDSNASGSQIYTSHRKLQDFFGEDPNAVARTQSTSTFPTLPSEPDAATAARPSFLRGRSFLNESAKPSRPVSPTNNRPKTPPQVSSEVTPWLFQDRQVRISFALIGIVFVVPLLGSWLSS